MFIRILAIKVDYIIGREWKSYESSGAFAAAKPMERIHPFFVLSCQLLTENVLANKKNNAPPVLYTQQDTV
jgi:hypothetical protein